MVMVFLNNSSRYEYLNRNEFYQSRKETKPFEIVLEIKQLAYNEQQVICEGSVFAQQ